MARNAASLFILYICVAIIYARDLPAQQTRQTETPLTYKVEVELMQTTVRVLDQSGRWVSGLRSTDLEIYEDGYPQTILYLDEVDSATPTAARVNLPQAEIPAEQRALSTTGKVQTNTLIIIVDASVQTMSTIAAAQHFPKKEPLPAVSLCTA